MTSIPPEEQHPQSPEPHAGQPGEPAPRPPEVPQRQASPAASPAPLGATPQRAEAPASPSQAPQAAPPTMTPPPVQPPHQHGQPQQYAPGPPHQTQQFAPGPPPMPPTGPMNTGPIPMPPQRPRSGRGAATGLAVLASILGIAAVIMTVLFVQKAGESSDHSDRITELEAAEAELEDRNQGLSDSLADLQEVSDQYDACAEAFQEYSDHEYDGDIDPNAENFEDLFTEEYIEWSIDHEELFREAERECTT